MLELEPAVDHEAAPAPDDSRLGEELRKYGTKLAEVARKLRQIKARDAAAKCIVFCQWDRLSIRK